MGLIPLLPPESTKRTRLEAGDCAFFGYGPEGPYTLPVGIEYKTAKEALQCLIDKRLEDHQLPKMSQLYKRVYLLIEGEYKEGPSGELLFKGWKDNKPVWSSFNRVTYSQFDNWLNGIAESGRVFLKRSIDRAESATQVYNLYKFWSKDYEQHKSLMRFSKDREPYQSQPPTNVEVIARQLPGIGHDLAHKSNSVFTTPQELANATEEVWITIPGVGKKTAQKIAQFWTSRK